MTCTPRWLPLTSEPITRLGMTPRHPGELVRAEILAELGLPIARAAEILGVRRPTLSDLVSGKTAVPPEMALPDGETFGVSIDTLLRMQASHDSPMMRQRAGEIDVRRRAGAKERS